ncbi:MAG TPA: aldehyde dehydrogenase family protein [Acidimicrobiales bacterium]|jgi:acyl-CoA reductase-like NAD-dependent aldehyde dehydrogenase|nr:aldehyde dehydrogenase family protein [Acidimicrobiales bacterium]
MTGLGRADFATGCFVAGKWLPVSEHYDVFDPATGARVGPAPRCTSEHVDAAVGAARDAFVGWSQTSLDERRDVLARIGAAIGGYGDALADLVVAETGALAPFARHVVVGFAEQRFAWHAQAKREWLSETWDVANPDGGSRSTMVVRQPVGVVAGVTPYNFQLPNVAAKVGAALVAGCTVVLKPAPQDPLASLRFCEIIEELDLPPGIINMVTSDQSDISQALVRHADVDMVSFTGSTAVGQAIATDVSPQFKRLLLELGGKSALVVTEGADVAAAAQVAATTWTVFSGQICTAPTRVVVHESVHAELVDVLAEIATNLVVGDPRDAATDMGPLISPAQLARVEAYVAGGVIEGARLVVDGRQAPMPEQGNFMGATLFDDTDSSMAIAREEIFGPVVCLTSVGSEEEAIAVANDSMYGLDGYVWADTAEHGAAIAGRMRTGHVSVNGAPVNPEAPFGGFRSSGLGRDRGVAGIQAYTEVQSIDLPA